MRYNVLCMRISNINIYVRTEMCTNNKFVSTLIWKRCLHTDMKMSRSIVLIFFLIYGVLMPLSTIFQLYHGDQFICQTNMYLIMWIENAFEFCGKLIHFYKERISFLFYFEDGERGAVSWDEAVCWRGAVSWLSLKTWGCQLTFIERCGSQADLSFTWCLQVSVVPLTVRWFLEETPWGFSAFLHL